MDSEADPSSGIYARLAVASDRSALHRLFHEMETHYHGDAAPGLAEVGDRVDAAVFVDRPLCEVAVAGRRGEEIQAFATFATLFPAERLTGQMIIKDLFTSAPARGAGLGRALLTFLAQLTVARGCSRLDWTTGASNEGALRFYDRLGARRVTEKVYCRPDGPALARLAGIDAEA